MMPPCLVVNLIQVLRSFSENFLMYHVCISLTIYQEYCHLKSCFFFSIACLAALQRHGECLALVNKRLDVEKDNPDLFVMRARLHDLFRNVSELCKDTQRFFTFPSKSRMTYFR